MEEKLHHKSVKYQNGVTVDTNYDFINEDSPIDQSELQDGEKIKPMTMGALLVALEHQNSML